MWRIQYRRACAAMVNGHTAVIEWLVEHYTDGPYMMITTRNGVLVNTGGYFRDRFSALHLKETSELAAARNHQCTAVMLLHHIYFSTSEALRTAIVNDHTRIVEILLWNRPATTDATMALEMAVIYHRIPSFG